MNINELEQEKPFDESGTIRVPSKKGEYICSRDKGVVFIPNGAEKGELLCSYIRPVARGKNKDGGGFSIQVEFLDQCGDLQKEAIAESEVLGNGQKLVLKLADLGLRVWACDGNNGINNPINRFLNLFPRDQLPFTVTVSSGGWLDENFNCYVFRNKTIRSDDASDAMPAAGMARRLPSLITKGTVDDWKSTTGKIAQYSKRLMFGIMVAFAGPLVRILERNTTFFGFYGPSGQGKTSICAGASSVWGPWEEFKNTWDSSTHSISELAANYNDLILIFDEIGQGELPTLKSAIYKLGNETGRQRLNPDISLQEKRMWHLFGLSSGEKGMSRIRAEKGGSGGMTTGERVRFPEIPSDAGTGRGVFDVVPDDIDTPEKRRELIDQYRTPKFYGTVGEMFLMKLIEEIKHQGLQTFRDTADAAIKKFESRFTDLSTDELRVLSAFSVVAYAGGLACQYQLVPWSLQETLAAVEVCFNAWRTSEMSARESAKCLVEGVLADTKNCRAFYLIEDIDPGKGADPTVTQPEVLDRILGNYGVIVKYRGHDVAALFSPGQFEKLLEWVGGGYSREEVLYVLSKENLLIENEKSRHQWRNRSKDNHHPDVLVKNARYFCVKLLSEANQALNLKHFF